MSIIYDDTQYFQYPPFNRDRSWYKDADYEVAVVSSIGAGPKGDMWVPTDEELEQIAISAIAHGAKGDKGDKGDTGDTGAQGQDGAQGPQGPQGIPGQTFSELTDEEKEELAALLIRTVIGLNYHEATYTTPEGTDSDNPVSTIEIPIDEYVSGDILFVSIEGLDIIRGAENDYLIDEGNITLLHPIVHSGTKVQFKCIHLITGSDEEE